MKGAFVSCFNGVMKNVTKYKGISIRTSTNAGWAGFLPARRLIQRKIADNLLAQRQTTTREKGAAEHREDKIKEERN